MIVPDKLAMKFPLAPSAAFLERPSAFFKSSLELGPAPKVLPSPRVNGKMLVEGETETDVEADHPI